ARVEHDGHEALARLVERIPELLLALLEEDRGLRQERFFVDHALVERPRVLRETQRAERAEQLREVDRVDERMADRQRRLLGIDVDRRRVDLEVLFSR